MKVSALILLLTNLFIVPVLTRETVRIIHPMSMSLENHKFPGLIYQTWRFTLVLRKFWANLSLSRNEEMIGAFLRITDSGITLEANPAPNHRAHEKVQQYFASAYPWTENHARFAPTPQRRGDAGDDIEPVPHPAQRTCSAQFVPSMIALKNRNGGVENTASVVPSQPSTQM